MDEIAASASINQKAFNVQARFPTTEEKALNQSNDRSRWEQRTTSPCAASPWPWRSRSWRTGARRRRPPARAACRSSSACLRAWTTCRGTLRRPTDRAAPRCPTCCGPARGASAWCSAAPPRRSASPSTAPARCSCPGPARSRPHLPTSATPREFRCRLRRRVRRHPALRPRPHRQTPTPPLQGLDRRLLQHPLLSIRTEAFAGPE